MCQNPLSMYRMAFFQVLKLAIFISPVARTNLTILKLHLCFAGVKMTTENLVIIKKKGNVIYKSKPTGEFKLGCNNVLL